MVLPTPPLPEVITTTRGVSPANWGFRFHWRTDWIGFEKCGLGGGFRVLKLNKGLNGVAGD